MTAGLVIPLLFAEIPLYPEFLEIRFQESFHESKTCTETSVDDRENDRETKLGRKQGHEFR